MARIFSLAPIPPQSGGTAVGWFSLARIVSLAPIPPQFGGTATKEQREAYALTGHYADGIFLNKEETSSRLESRDNRYGLREKRKEMKKSKMLCSLRNL